MPNISQSQPIGVPVNFVPSIIGKQPKEGHKSIPFLVNWSRPLASSLDTVSVNVQGNSPLDFTQIVSLIIDNSQCGASLDFIFPDTDVTLSIPAYAPYTVAQVNTRQLQFFVRALGPIASDVTSFSVLNYAADPLSVPATTEQQFASFADIFAQANTNQQIAAATVNGTIQHINIGYAVANDVSGGTQVATIQDGSRVLFRTRVATNNNASNINLSLLNFNNIALRFSDGLTFQIGGAENNLTGRYFLNILYRTP